jgi:hypothetical protein
VTLRKHRCVQDNEPKTRPSLIGKELPETKGGYHKL